MPNPIPIIAGKLTRLVSHIKGNGSALPGYVVERLSPDFIKFLSDLPNGVIVVSGTNGKTTTTKIITEILHAGGLRVFTNDTGSNFVRGIISSALPHMSITGKFPFDIAVLELDEAHAVRFCEQVKPTYSLLLNVARDQLDRFGEVDHVASLLNLVAQNTTQAVIINREDPRLMRIQTTHNVYFGLSQDLKSQFPSDVDQRDINSDEPQPDATILRKIDGKSATYVIDGKAHAVDLKLRGIYNAYNAAGAIAVIRRALPSMGVDDILKALSEVTSAYGRGETITFDGKQIEIFLVKNPAAFQLSLTSFADNRHDFFIAINDNISDGRDVSWLWDVDFRDLPPVITTSGTRAADMALRLQYDEVKTLHIETDIKTALQHTLDKAQKPIRIFATYSAMMELRKIMKGKSIL